VKRWQLLGVGAATYIIGLIVTLPATVVDAVIRRLSHDRVAVAEARGTLWTGSGQLEFRNADLRTGIAQGIGWNFLPQMLLRARLGWEVELAASRGHTIVSLTPSRVEFLNADIQLPAAALGFAIPALAPLDLRGELQLSATQVALESSGIWSDAVMQWRAASSALSAVAPLGNYELRVEGNGSEIQASLRTLQGPVQLDGKGSWSRGAAPAFRATARVPPELGPQLEPLLRLIAVQQGNGVFELRLDDRWQKLGVGSASN